MKKNKKKLKRKIKKKTSKKIKKKTSRKKNYKNKKKIKKYFKKKIVKKRKLLVKVKKSSSEGIILKIIRFQEKIKDKFSIKFKFNFLSIDKAVQNFFQRIDNKFIEYKTIKAEEKRRIRIEEIDKIKKEKEKIEKIKVEEKEKEFKFKQQQLKDEQKI